MRRQPPDASTSLTILLFYIGIGCVAALAVLAVRWWWRRRDPLNLRHRSYTERLGHRFDRKRARPRRAARKAAGRRRRP